MNSTELHAVRAAAVQRALDNGWNAHYAELDGDRAVWAAMAPADLLRDIKNRTYGALNFLETMENSPLRGNFHHVRQALSEVVGAYVSTRIPGLSDEDINRQIAYAAEVDFPRPRADETDFWNAP
jgi:hypothetical protein